MRNRVVAGVLGAAAVLSGALHLHPISALAATCPAVFNNVEVEGGAAAWTVTCTGDTLFLDGWVRDTKADGKFAFVKAFIHGGREEARACPKGTTTKFTFTQQISRYGRSATA